jgi:hypothetical protein
MLIVLYIAMRHMFMRLWWETPCTLQAMLKRSCSSMDYECCDGGMSKSGGVEVLEGLL